MNGFEVCRRLKQDERTRDVPIIFVSALQDVDDRVQGFEVGGVDFVSKPFEESEVLARVKTHVQLRAMQLHLEELVAERTAELTQANTALKAEIAERKRAENELRESEERFRATFEQAAVGIAHVAPDGRFLRINQRFCDIAGYSRDEMLARPFQDITHPDDLDAHLEPMHRLLDGEADSYSVEKRYLRRSREIVWVNLTVSLLWEGVGEPSYFISVVEDITERKQVESQREAALEALHESEERYRTLVEQAQDGIAVIQDGKIRFANAYVAGLSGRTVEELLDSSFEAYVTADQLPKVVDMFRRRMNNESVPSIYESAIQHKDGSQVEVEFNAGLTTYDGKDAVLVMVRDITQRKRTEEELRKRSERLEEAQRTAQTGDWEYDIQAGKVTWSDEMYRIFGVDPRRYVPSAKSDEEFCHPDDAPALRKALGHFFATEEELDIDYRIVTPQGTLKSCRRRGRLVLDDQGIPSAARGTTEDITKGKLVEQQIMEYQQQLQSLASQLTLTEERERRRIATELHDQVGQTLAFARMRLASAGKATSDAQREAILDDVSQSLRQAIGDTRDLVFDLSSPLMNELGLAAALSEWLEEQVGKRHGLQTEFIHDGQRLLLDDDMRAMLFRSGRELLTNVVKHAQAKRVTVRLEYEGTLVRIVVEDDGVGFDVDAMPEAMEREGGFGLFSIQERMADLGGSLEITSEPGQGCTAILTAPTTID